MKIFVEATPIFSSVRVPKAGIAYFIENIYKALIKIDIKNQYTLFGVYFMGRKKDFTKEFSPDTRYRLIRYVPGKVWSVANRKGWLPPLDLMMPSRPDVILYSNFQMYPMLQKTKRVVVIHDIAFARYPQFVIGKYQKYLVKFTPKALRKAELVVAVSEFTKQDIVDYYKIDPKKIVVVHNAVDQKRFHPTGLTNDVRKRYKLPGEYLLFMGTLEPRKNVQRIVEAYNELSSEIRTKYPLVLAGGKGWLDQGIENAIQQVKTPGKVIRTGYIDDDDMAAVYSGAKLFLFPSNYEGFGIPVLEAMACGTPVITADNSSLPEVAGTAALYVKAEDVKDITAQITKLISDPSLAKELRVKGFEQVKKFSWEKSAQSLLWAIEKL